MALLWALQVAPPPYLVAFKSGHPTHSLSERSEGSVASGMCLDAAGRRRGRREGGEEDGMEGEGGEGMGRNKGRRREGKSGG